jgi:hypothetical protein
VVAEPFQWLGNGSKDCTIGSKLQQASNKAIATWVYLSSNIKTGTEMLLSVPVFFARRYRRSDTFISTEQATLITQR